ncbi:RNA-binding protein Y14 [Argentina anserina]|uniref:RNA-binding protein Y14 n=1 Tax=Argentina anserina TaxID=57926 RepID=UPI0021765E66|nr:RNA-binding protein Y14 [Potentilla anserina]
MANNADVEAVDFEPEDDDLMDEDGAIDADPSASPRAAPPHKLKSAITGAASASLSAPKKTKGRGFREDRNTERSTRLAVSDLDALRALDGLEPQRSIEGWIILVTGIHEEAQEEDLLAIFGEYGEIKNLHLNLDRRTGFVKGYALIEYENFSEAQAAISKMDGDNVLTQVVNVDWAFSNGSFLDGSKKKNPRQLRDRRSRSPHRERRF